LHVVTIAVSDNMDGRLALTPAEIGGTVSRWLVPTTARVREGQAIADIVKPGGGKALYEAPVAGSVSWRGPDDGILRFCKHEALLSGKLCLNCGVDVSKLSAKTLAFLHARHVMRGGQSVASGATGAAASKPSGPQPAAVAAALLPSMRNYRLQGGIEFSLTDAYAQRADSSIMRRLRAGRKLSLVLDLDHTLIHTSSDPAVAALASSHPALRGRDDIFVLHDARAVFTVKLRPHARAFLQNVSESCELL
jgi:hypothetical protein